LKSERFHDQQSYRLVHNLCNLRDSWQGSIISQELEPTLGLLQNQYTYTTTVQKSLLLAHQLCLFLDDKRFLSWIHNTHLTYDKVSLPATSSPSIHSSHHPFNPYPAVWSHSNRQLLLPSSEPHFWFQDQVHSTSYKLINLC